MRIFNMGVVYVIFCCCLVLYTKCTLSTPHGVGTDRPFQYEALGFLQTIRFKRKSKVYLGHNQKRCMIFLGKN